MNSTFLSRTGKESAEIGCSLSICTYSTVQTRVVVARFDDKIIEFVYDYLIIKSLHMRVCVRLVGKCTVPMSNLLRAAGAIINVALCDANKRPLGVSITRFSVHSRSANSYHQ